MPTLPESTAEQRRQQAMLNAQYDQLLNICNTCSDDEWAKQRANLKRVADELTKVNRDLKPAGIYRRIIIGANSSSGIHR